MCFYWLLLYAILEKWRIIKKLEELGSKRDNVWTIHEIVGAF